MSVFRYFVGVLTLGYSNIVNLLVESSVLKHAKYTKTVISKCETIIYKCYTEKKRVT